jgi:hypothetical protein
MEPQFETKQIPVTTVMSDAQTAKPSLPFVEPTFNASEECCICGGRFIFCLCFPFMCGQCQTIEAYESGVVLRMGKRLQRDALPGGMHFIVPCVDNLVKIDIRETM